MLGFSTLPCSVYLNKKGDTGCLWGSCLIVSSCRFPQQRTIMHIKVRKMCNESHRNDILTVWNGRVGHGRDYVWLWQWNYRIFVIGIVYLFNVWKASGTWGILICILCLFLCIYLHPCPSLSCFLLYFSFSLHFLCGWHISSKWMPSSSSRASLIFFHHYS